MGENTKIEWADDSVNIWWGCQRHGTGCQNCYAESLASRFHPDWKLWGNSTNSVRLYMPKWQSAIRRLNAKAQKEGKPRVVFINSMSDFFEDFTGPLRWAGKVDGTDERVLFVPWHGPKRMIDDSTGVGVVKAGEMLGLGGGWGSDVGSWQPLSGYRHATVADLREEAFRVFDECRWLRFMLLTKRPENILRTWPRGWWKNGLFNPCANDIGDRSNVFIGTSVSCQEDADKNIPELLKCRDLSPVLFISAEPLTWPVYLRQWLACRKGFFANVDSLESKGKVHHKRPGVDLLIIGGESGPNARPCDIAWVRSLVTQCRHAGAFPFLKQLGSNVVTQIPAMQVAGATNRHGPNGRVPAIIGQMKFRDPKGADTSEWPEDLQNAREFPDLD